MTYIPTPEDIPELVEKHVLGYKAEEITLKHLIGITNQTYKV